LYSTVYLSIPVAGERLVGAMHHWHVNGRLHWRCGCHTVCCGDWWVGEAALIIAG